MFNPKEILMVAKQFSSHSPVQLPALISGHYRWACGVHQGMAVIGSSSVVPSAPDAARPQASPPTLFFCLSAAPWSNSVCAQNSTWSRGNGSFIFCQRVLREKENIFAWRISSSQAWRSLNYTSRRHNAGDITRSICRCRVLLTQTTFSLSES